MKVKSNKAHIILITMIVLLIFATLTLGSTHSYLTDESTISFTAQVANINITLKQDDRPLTSTDNNIYLGTDIIEGDHTYTTNVSLINNETSTGYYVRFKVVAVVGGTAYNINDYITTPFYKDTDGWAYNTASSSSSTPKALEANQTKVVLESFKIPTTASAGKLCTSNMQGKNFKLYLYVEGSPSASFDI